MSKVSFKEMKKGTKENKRKSEKGKNLVAPMFHTGVSNNIRDLAICVWLDGAV